MITIVGGYFNARIREKGKEKEEEMDNEREGQRTRE